MFVQIVTARKHKLLCEATEIRMSKQELGLCFGLCRLSTGAFLDLQGNFMMQQGTSITRDLCTILQDLMDGNIG